MTRGPRDVVAGSSQRRIDVTIDQFVRAGAVLGLAATLVVAAAPAGDAHEAHGHPAKLHEGSCADLGRVVATFNGVGGEVDLAGNPVAQAEAVNPDSAYQVMRSETESDLSLDDILAAPHALMVYESDEDLTGIACGNLGGARLGDELAVGLAEINTPGHVGLALFEADDAGLDVTIYVGHALSPVSAGGVAADDHDDAADAHDDGPVDDHDAAATPAGDA